MGLLGFLALIVFTGWARRREATLLDRLQQLERRIGQLERRGTSDVGLPAASSPDAPAAVASSPIAFPESPAAPLSPPLPVGVPAVEAPPDASVPPPFESVPPPPDPPAGTPWRPDVNIDWERLFGVRAAAVLGGVTLALAGLLFFKYSIEHGLIPPGLRVLIGCVTGIACLIGSERSWRRRYVGTANALAGAGVVILYAAAWAAGVLYQLVSAPLAFAAMVGVTVACCALAARHESLVIALLGLAGGFATPLLVSTGADRPLGLFGYVLLLDLALLGLGRLRSWSLLAPLSLAGTLLYQTLWIGFRMGPEEDFFALAMLATFAIAFAVALGRRTADDAQARITAAGAVLLPFAFAVYLVSRVELGGRFLPLAAFMGLLSAAACWIARVQRVPFLPLAVASAVAGVTAEWLLPRELSVGRAWEVCLAAAALAAVVHGFEVEARRRDGVDPWYGAFSIAAGLFVTLWIGWMRTELLTPWPWVAGLGALAAMMARQGGFAERAVVQLPAAFGVVMAAGLFLHHRTLYEDAPIGAVLLRGFVATALAYQWIARRRRGTPSHAMTEHAAGIVTAGLVMWLSPQWRTIDPPWFVLLAVSGFGLLLASVAARIEGEWQSGLWMGMALATAIVHADWVQFEGDAPRFGLGLQSLVVILLTAWPALRWKDLRERRLPWLLAACAGLAWVPAFRLLAVRLELAAQEGWFVLALALPAATMAWRVRTWSADAVRDRTAVVAWYAAAAFAVVTVALPILLEREWLTIALGLEAVALAAVWTRIDYPALKWFALGLVIAVAVRLVGNPWVLEYHARPAWRIVNWISTTYLVPAVAAFAVAALLQPTEVARATTWERDVVFDYDRPYGAVLSALVGLVLVFCWLNLEILDWFATGAVLTIDLDRLPARDLTMSVAWGLYAVGLLALGMARRSIGLRWVSLVFLLVTIAKVFLYDLGELRDLYRVASLLGLAVSLLGVSVAYQRFVFRGEPAVDPPPPAG